MNGSPWTPEDDKIMLEKYADNYTADLCKLLNRTPSSVYGRASFLCLCKSEAFKQMELQRQGDRLKKVGANGRFLKGHVSANKGAKMPKHVYEKAKATMFKKGQLPHNVKHDGHERISKDGYIEVRVALGVYKQKHRIVWEQAHGEIPKGHAVVFKDGNKQNVALENLELITRKLLMQRNSITRFPPELRSTIHQLKKLKQYINEKQN